MKKNAKRTNAKNATLDTRVGKWMLSTYPKERRYMRGFNKTATFRDVLRGMLAGEDFYDILHCTESVEREYVFAKFSEMLGAPHDAFYLLWLDGPNGNQFKPFAKRLRAVA